MHTHACARLQVREMSVAEFFRLSAEEARMSTLPDLGGRLAALAAAKPGAGVCRAVLSRHALAHPSQRMLHLSQG